MKILQVIPTLQKGGAERLALDICNELGKREGIEVKLVSLKGKNLYGDLSTNVDWEEVPSYFMPSLTGKAKVDVSAFVKVVNDFKPDVIHSHLFEADMVSRYQLFKGVKYFSHCHDNMPQFEKFSFQTLLDKAKTTNYYERAIIIKQDERCNNQFISISKDNFLYFKRMLPESLKNNVHLLPNAINFQKFNAANVTRSNTPIRIINTGSFIPKKNQILLVEVMNVLKKRGIPASLTFLGAGPFLERVKAKAEEYGLSDCITFAGNVEHVENYLHHANLYAHSSYSEAFGLVLLEAMAAGLPVVALDGKGNRDLVKDGVNGFFILEQDTELFADKIVELMSSNERYQQMSSNAVQFAKGYDIKDYVDKLLQLYKSAY